ncbi:hypothetical protein [Salinicola rhizosphaerae]|uniref:Lipoprotein n=1 Tax=Salinicola rhizosphaerae TaxID=1443141 RepID=A0ABQ3E907_9GAMM|nr:hypothetical protein [Salinicola rhizosphaerae]GHB29994.1 hypothetical protein GCM10009038_30920 [Salinicola rhizosphaerae]
MLLAAPLVLGACQAHGPDQMGSPRPADRGAPTTTTFSAPDHEIAVTYDATFERLDAPEDGYFDNGSWASEAGDDGERLLTLSLPDSDEITTGLWRLGTSRNARALETCTDEPSDMSSAAPETVRIGGHDFVSFTVGDAGMSHFQSIHAYRAVVDDTCYAIDLIVQGTRGDVYDPPRPAPFSQDAAMARLRTINTGVSFPSGH